MNEVVLRLAQPSDAAAIQRIYGYYVENTAITCEVAIPSLTDLTERIKKTQQRFPYLIATLGDQVVGFAYVSPANPRYAYQWTVETSIYVDRNCRGKHVGTKLYDMLEKICRQMKVVNMTAHIVYPHDDQPDQHLTLASPKFHEAYGYKLTGRFYKNVYKFGKWYDMLWMEKSIAKHDDAPTPIVNFNEIKSQFFN